jgi:hypothetical protein
MLYYLVMRYQIHYCQDHICGGVRRFGIYKKGAPWPISNHTFYEPGNPRYMYRRGPADTRVSSYNAELLLLWQGHLNVQYATSQGLTAYICKYITKTEPLFEVSYIDGATKLQRHLKARRIGLIETIIHALGLNIFRCSSGVQYLGTNVLVMRTSTIRPLAKIKEDPKNPYYPDAIKKYFARLVTYNQLTFFNYFRQYIISKKRHTRSQS